MSLAAKPRMRDQIAKGHGYRLGPSEVIHHNWARKPFEVYVAGGSGSTAWRTVTVNLEGPTTINGIPVSGYYVDNSHEFSPVIVLPAEKTCFLYVVPRGDPGWFLAGMTSDDSLDYSPTDTITPLVWNTWRDAGAFGAGPVVTTGTYGILVARIVTGTDAAQAFTAWRQYLDGPVYVAYNDNFSKHIGSQTVVTGVDFGGESVETTVVHSQPDPL